MAGSTIIGLASATGGITLDDARVTGSATLFDGTRLIANGYSRLHLNNGTRMDFAAGARAQIFANHAALEAGMSEFESASGFEIEVRTLKIRLSEKNSIARVRIDPNDKRIYVTALKAPVSVLNADGLLVAKVIPGVPYSFLPQAASAANSYDAIGCVLQKNGAAVLSDDSGSHITELRGFDLRKAIGKRTHVTGVIDPTAVSAGGGSQVVRVTKATFDTKGLSCLALALKLGDSTVAIGLAAGVGAGGAAVGGTAVGAAGAATAAGAGAAAGAAAAGGAAVGGVAAIAGVAAAGAVAAGVIGTAVANNTQSTPSP